jgi:hypothetical protein
MFAYNEAHYARVADARVRDHLSTLLPHEELLNHISTVFYASGVAIEVGKENPTLQAYMREEGIRYLIGMTPKFPIFNPCANESENQAYVEEFQRSLDIRDISYIPCWGRARDFREGGDGCFILVDVCPDSVKELLSFEGTPTQLSFTCLYQHEPAELVSCVENVDLYTISVQNLEYPASNDSYNLDNR